MITKILLHCHIVYWFYDKLLSDAQSVLLAIKPVYAVKISVPRTAEENPLK
jgi:hypothetical protein